MAMTKAEKAEMEQLRMALALSRAMKWPDYPVPAHMTEAEIRTSITEEVEHYGHLKAVAAGFNAYFPSYVKAPTVDRVISDGMGHSSSGGSSWAQGAGRLYRTPREALMALRHKKTKEVAEMLAAIDLAIAEAE